MIGVVTGDLPAARAGWHAPDGMFRDDPRVPIV
jgi:hypothetical protein